MSDLIPKTIAQRIAERIDRTQAELVNHVEAMLRTLHASVNTEGEQQNILDAFGPNAVAALTKYEAMRQAVLAIKPAANVPAPDLDAFVPNEDGTVTYVAPEPEPEPETES